MRSLGMRHVTLKMKRGNYGGLAEISGRNSFVSFISVLFFRTYVFFIASKIIK